MRLIRLLLGLGTLAGLAVVSGFSQVSLALELEPHEVTGSPVTAAQPPAPQPPASGRALVLGGGGPTGAAWEIGVLKGLRDAGVDLTQADLIVGTSAGAERGALIAAGRDIDSLFADALAAPLAAPAISPIDPAYLEETSRLWQQALTVAPPLLVEVGQRALDATAVTSEDDAISNVRRRIGLTEWPDRPFRVAAVNVQDGSVQFFDRTQAVPLARALAASQARPGAVAPITINGQRYMDGMVRGLNLDGASSSGIIVALSPSFRATTQQEVEAARARGAQILAITLDGAASEAQGSNVFDFSRVAPSANAGYRQGLALAEEVAKLWNPLPVPTR